MSLVSIEVLFFAFAFGSFLLLLWNRSLKPINRMCQGRFDEAILAEEALEKKSGSNERVRVIHRFNRAVNLSWKGEAALSNSVLESIKPELLAPGVRAMLHLHTTRNFLLLSEEHLDDAERHLEMANSMGGADGRLVSLFSAHLLDRRGLHEASECILKKIAETKTTRHKKASLTTWLIFPRKLNQVQEDFFRGYHLFKLRAFDAARENLDKVTGCGFENCYSLKARQLLSDMT